MIDINELRRLAQAATPGPWINYGRQPNAPGAPHSAVAAKTLLARVYSEAYGDVAQETANADLIAAVNPAAISELLDRLEAAESEALEQARLNGMGSEREAALMAKLEAAERDRATFITEIGNLCAKVEAAERKCDVEQRRARDLQMQCCDLIAEVDALRAKIEEIEKQEPVAWIARGGYPVPLDKLEWQLWYGSEKPTLSWVNQETRPLYALPGAQPAPSVPDDGFKRAVMEIADIGYEAIFKRLLCERAAELAETAPKANP